MTEPTSACSPESGDSILRSNDSVTDASDRSKLTSRVPGSSSDTGLTSRDGEMLLPTPTSNQPGGTAEQHLARKNRMPDGATRTSITDLRMAVESISSAADFLVSRPPTLASGRAERTTAGYGPSSPVLLASYDRDTSSWRTFQGSLLSTEDERFPRSWETWPRSGLMRDGQAFALPTSVPATGESGYSSSLPTPAAADGTGGKQHRIGSISMTGQREDGTKVQVSLRDALNLLPTPRYEGFDAGNHRGDPDSLNQTVRQMLPTPRSTDTNGRGDWANRDRRTDHIEARVHRDLLPTPSAYEAEHGGSQDPEKRKAGNHSIYLSDRIEKGLLGDPTEPPSDDGSE